MEEKENIMNAIEIYNKGEQLKQKINMKKLLKLTKKLQN